MFSRIEFGVNFVNIDKKVFDAVGFKNVLSDLNSRITTSIN